MEINSTDFKNKVIDSNKPVVVEVYTETCPNCKRLHPIFEKAASENSDDFYFYKMNALPNLDLAKQYKILGVPTLLYFVHGKLVNKKTGVTTAKKISKRLNILLTYTKEIADKKEITGYFKLPWK